MSASKDETKDVIEWLDPNKKKFKLGSEQFSVGAKCDDINGQASVNNSTTQFEDNLTTGKGPLYKSGLLQKFMNCVGYPCVIAGGYSTFIIGDTISYGDVDFFTVLPESYNFTSIIQRILISKNFRLSKQHWRNCSKYNQNRKLLVFNFDVIKYLNYHFQLIIDIVPSLQTSYDMLDNILKMAKYVTDAFDLNICKSVGVRWTDEEIKFFRTHSYQLITESVMTTLESLRYSPDKHTENYQILANLGMKDAIEKLNFLHEMKKRVVHVIPSPYVRPDLLGNLCFWDWFRFTKRIKKYFKRQAFKVNLIGENKVNTAICLLRNELSK